MTAPRQKPTKQPGAAALFALVAILAAGRASAQEPITLESIGAVRMAQPGDAARVDDFVVAYRAQTRPQHCAPQSTRESSGSMGAATEAGALR